MNSIPNDIEAVEGLKIGERNEGVGVIEHLTVSPNPEKTVRFPGYPHVIAKVGEV